MHIYSLFILKWDYLKARKLEVIEQNYLEIWIQHTQINKKTPIPILASDQKFIFVNQWFDFSNSSFCYSETVSSLVKD